MTKWPKSCVKSYERNDRQSEYGGKTSENIEKVENGSRLGWQVRGYIQVDVNIQWHGANAN